MTRYDPLLEPEQFAEEIESCFRQPRFRINLPKFAWGSKIEISGPRNEPLFFCEMRPHVRDYFSLYSSGDNAYLLLTVRRFAPFAAVLESFTVVDQLAKQQLGRLRHRLLTWPPGISLEICNAAGKLAARVVELGGWSRIWTELIDDVTDYNAQIETQDGISIGSLYLERYAQSGELNLPRSTPDGLSPRLVVVGAVIALQVAYESMVSSDVVD